MDDPLRKIKLSSDLILEAGCGGGQAMNYCLKLNYHVVGIDISKKMLQTCKRNAEHESVSFVLADTRFLPFTDNSFDTCLSLGVIEHLNAQNLAFNELCRVSKKKIVLSLPFPFSVYHLFTKIAQLLHISELDKEDGFTIEKITKIFEQKRFTVKKIIKLVMLPKYFEMNFIKKFVVSFADVLDNMLTNIDMGYRFIFYIIEKDN